MRFERYSAIKMFGAPLDTPEQANDTDSLVNLMRSYDIEPEEIPRDSTDITPYYWQNPNFRYFLSLQHPEGPAVVELMPRHEGSEAHLIGRTATVGFCISGVRRIEVPGDQDAAAIVGPGPRFPDRISIHELITYTDTE